MNVDCESKKEREGSTSLYHQEDFSSFLTYNYVNRDVFVVEVDKNFNKGKLRQFKIFQRFCGFGDRKIWLKFCS